MIKNLKRITFTLIVFFIPINLGKHFINIEAFVHSKLIDYLIPTIWFTDILILFLLVLWVIDGGLKRIKNKTLFRFLLIFVAVLLPSVLVSQRLEPSIYFFLTFILRIGFMFYISEECVPDKNFTVMVRVFSLSVILLSIMAFIQWSKQGSVFNNYLFFGEQPYTTLSTDVTRINLFGRIRIPVYGTFRHPNIFGGFLSLVLIWIYFKISNESGGILFKTAFTLGFLSLILTFSQTALLTFCLSIMFLFLIEKYGRKGVLVSLVTTFTIFVIGFLLPLLQVESLLNDPSFFRRVNLLKSSYTMLQESPFFGVGLNNFTIILSKFLPLTQILIFNQPVHNIFVLLLVEGGVFTLVTFLLLIFISIYTVLKQSYGVAAVLFVTILNIIILGSFDHYLITINQTQTMLWLTLGLSLAYTKVDEK